ncbi:MAG: tRNA-specific adenosine deaminase, partial [Proteobacteria bacterium]|nr:tRNA-specific adenosine deaminase [Pseudomonadota bacterium]
DHPMLNHRVSVTEGILAEEAADRLRMFARALRIREARSTKLRDR